MMVDEKLDNMTHDLAYENYDEQLVRDVVGSPAQILQNIKIRLLFIKGEYFLDATRGAIDFDLMATKQDVKSVMDATLKATIQDTQGVNSILEYESTLDGPSRQFAVSFKCDTIYGPVSTQNTRIQI